jgi:hypothetical protein
MGKSDWKGPNRDDRRRNFPGRSKSRDSRKASAYYFLVTVRAFAKEDEQVNIASKLCSELFVRFTSACKQFERHSVLLVILVLRYLVSRLSCCQEGLLGDVIMRC